MRFLKVFELVLSLVLIFIIAVTVVRGNKPYEPSPTISSNDIVSFSIIPITNTPPFKYEPATPKLNIEARIDSLERVIKRINSRLDRHETAIRLLDYENRREQGLRTKVYR